MSLVVSDARNDGFRSFDSKCGLGSFSEILYTH